MHRQSKSVRLVADDGGVITVDPDLDGNVAPVTLEVRARSADEKGAVVTASVALDAETADALVDALDEARGRRRRYRRGEAEAAGARA